MYKCDNKCDIFSCTHKQLKLSLRLGPVAVLMGEIYLNIINSIAKSLPVYSFVALHDICCVYASPPQLVPVRA